MTTKQLAIKVTLSDAASAGLRAVTAQAIELGRRAMAVTRGLMAPVAGLVKSLFSLKTVLAGALGALAGGVAFQSIRRAAEEMDELVKTSRQLGISAQFLSELKYAADLSGVAFEGLSSSAAKAARNIEEALSSGRGRAADAFRELGVSLRGSTGEARPFETVLLDLSDAFNKLDDSYKRVAYAQDIFGKGGTQMLRLLELGRPAIAAMAEEARRLGVVFTDEQLENAEQFNDAISRIGKAWLGLRAGIIGQAGDEMAELMNRIASAVAAVPEIVGNVMTALRQALDANSPEGQRVLDSIAALGQGIVGVVNSIAFASIAALAGAIVDGSKVLLSVVDDVAIGVAKQWVTSFGRALSLSQDLMGWHEIARLTREGVAEINDVFSEENLQGSFRESFIAAMSEATAGTEALALGIDHISGQVVQLGRDADALFGVSEAMAKTAVDAASITDALRGIRPALEDVEAAAEQAGESLNEGAKGFREGWISAMEEITEQSRNTFALAGDLVRSLTIDVSRDLANALANAATGAKNFGDSMLDALRSILEGITQAITQFLILRAIMGVAGSFGGSASLVGSVGGTGSQALPSYGGMAFANKGLLSSVPNVSLPASVLATVMAAGVPAYASGTSSVPGPYTNRDVTLAMLTPREAVLTPRAADTLGRDRISHLNRGGSMDGGGVVFAPVINVTVQASSGTDGAQVGRDIGRTLAGELMKEISRNPAVRAQLRRQIG